MNKIKQLLQRKKNQQVLFFNLAESVQKYDQEGNIIEEIAEEENEDDNEEENVVPTAKTKTTKKTKN